MKDDGFIVDVKPAETDEILSRKRFIWCRGILMGLEDFKTEDQSTHLGMKGFFNLSCLNFKLNNMVIGLCF